MKNKEELRKELLNYINSIRVSIKDLSYYVCSACPLVPSEDCPNTCASKYTVSELMENLDKLLKMLNEYMEE